jgi:hypothetical protein
METKIHKLCDRHCVLCNEDDNNLFVGDKWMQILFLRSAWADLYYVITENVGENKHECVAMSKQQIIDKYGHVPELEKEIFFDGGQLEIKMCAE